MGLQGQRVAVWLVAVIAAASWPAGAQERYRRDWSHYPGMPRSVRDLTFDDRGFLWLVGVEGVHRFDGHQVVRWGERPEGMLVGVNRGPGSRMVAWTEQGLLYEIAADGLVPVAGPPFEDVGDADFDDRGALWVADAAGLFRRQTGGDWERIDVPALRGQSPIRLRPAEDGGAYVGTRQGRFLRIRPDLTAETWFDEPTGGITRIAVKDGRTQAFCLRLGSSHGVYLVVDGHVSALHESETVARERWTGLTFRNDTLWAASTTSVHAFDLESGATETLGSSEGFEPGGELVVDRDLSLWGTSFRGLYQYTEPDVILWKDTDGTRGVHTAGGQVVLGRWDGAQRLTGDGTWEPLVAEDHVTFDWGGVSPWNTYWFVGVEHPNTPRARSALLEFRDDGWTSWLDADWGVFVGGYARDDDGTFWIAFYDSVWRVDGPGSAPREVARLATERPVINGFFVRGRQVSYVSRFDATYCEGVLDDDRSALAGDWACEPIDGAGEVLDLTWVDGEPWIGTWYRGAMRRHDGVWETVVDAAELGTDAVRGVEPSPRGGVWVTTYLERVRVGMRDDRPGILERLGPWMGVPDWQNFDVFEQQDGSLWLSGFSSAVWIPASARQRPVPPPRVFVTGFRADGRDLSPDETQELPATTERVELSWAAPAFRDPASLRFEVRADSDGDWLPAAERSFRFVGLGAGDYRVEVRASLDGETWSEVPADVRFAIRSPLWRRPATWAGLSALGAIAVLVVQWQRTRQQVRLERQRTEIAMNLHDELGAGLGSIGLLADLAADPSMDPAEGREVVGRVGQISRGLSRSLSDIVWTLRPQSVDLPGFALFLRQRASDLLAAGDTTVEFDFPEPVPAMRIELAVRRQIHPIASEALHNAARHSGASRVRVALRPDGAAWVLTIEDDGVGLDPDDEPAGLGRASMERRAAAIGARLRIDAGERGGCRVRLRFTPTVEDSA